MNRIYHKIKYIYWSQESKLIHLSQEQLNEKYKELVSKGYQKVPYSTDRATYVLGKSLSVQQKGHYMTLYAYEDDTFVRYTTNAYDRNKVTPQGSKAITSVGDKFYELTGVTFKKAFDTVSEIYKRCIPKQFIYVNSKLKDKDLICSSIDACSHYPGNLRGRLPDAHNVLKVPGTVKPTEDHPFAFYIKSGHCAEYGVFDTHEWVGHPVFKLGLFRYNKEVDGQNPSLDPKDDYTILMGASKYQLTDTMNYFYNIKQTYNEDTEEYKNAKLVMNAAIGMLHTKNYVRYRYAHLVAIALCRANNSILKKADEIGLSHILHICVDGIIYLGKDIYGTPDKQFGVYHQEEVGLHCKVSGPNRYIFMDGVNCEKVKTQGFTHNKDGSPITKETVHSLDDQYNWICIKPLEEINNGEKTLQEEN